MNRCEGCNLPFKECQCRVCDCCCTPCSCDHMRDKDEEYYRANATDINFYNYWEHESYGGYSE